MSDMTAVIVPKSDQINADDLIAGPMTIRITEVTVTGGTEQPVSMGIAGSQKVYRPCKSMSRVLVAAWGPDSKAYAGRQLTLYRDPKVKWGGMEVGGIRISHMSNIDKELTMMLTMTKQNRAPHKVKPLVAAPEPQLQPAGMTPDDALAIADKVAKRGTEAFRNWYNTNEGKAARATGALTPEAMVKLRGVATAADEVMRDDPFGLPPVDDAPPITPDLAEQIARDLAAERAGEGS